jgi:hypothetical protein
MRVCNTCYAAVDEHFASLEWSGHSSAEVRNDNGICNDCYVGLTQMVLVVIRSRANRTR